MHYVYLVRNLVLTDWVYVGCSNFPQKRWKEHSSPFNPELLGKAIRMFGVDSFSFEVLTEHEDRKEAEKIERQTIRKFRKEGFKVYNKFR